MCIDYSIFNQPCIYPDLVAPSYSSLYGGERAMLSFLPSRDLDALLLIAIARTIPQLIGHNHSDANDRVRGRSIDQSTGQFHAGDKTTGG